MARGVWSTARAGEKIGGGYIVLRRYRQSGRIKIAGVPFEHASLQDAYSEAVRLGKLHPSHQFEVFASSFTLAPSAPAAEPATPGETIPA